jgi:hypothetical protein
MVFLALPHPLSPEEPSMKFSEEALKYLNLGIESEIAAYVFYKRARKMVEDESLRKTLDKLAMDEKGHFLILENEFDQNVRSECWAPYKDILGKEGLPEGGVRTVQRRLIQVEKPGREECIRPPRGVRKGPRTIDREGAVGPLGVTP